MLTLKKVLILWSLVVFPWHSAFAENQGKINEAFGFIVNSDVPYAPEKL
ncbi:MAG: hypothetical protein ACI8Z1_003889, partial [Candidatus Azotimanducaceae bacterium]